MRIVEISDIDRPPERVWRHVIEPARFIRWNDKLVETDAGDAFEVGFPFRSRYRMGRTTSSFRSSVVEVVPGRRLVLRHAHPDAKGADPRMEVTERIEIEPRGAGCRVTKEVLVKHAGIPWWLRPFIWMITRFGRPVGPDLLKEACEADAD